MIQASFTVPLPHFDLEVDLNAPSERTLAILGPNGSGKSTALLALAGLVRPAEGQIVMDGRTLFHSATGLDLPPWERRCGMLFQDFALFPHLTALENVRYGLECQRVPRSKAGTVASEWLDRVGIGTEQWNARPGQLSGGQQQRVALARALAAGRSALLLDEPFSGLDVRTRQNTRAELLSAVRGAGITTVLVTHDPLDARLLGDQIVVLERGKVIQAGAPEELLSQPRSAFVADLAGLNLFPASLGPAASSGDLREAVSNGLVFHVLDDGPPGEVFLSFGAAEVIVSPGAPASSARNVFTGVVTSITPVGTRERMTVDVGLTIAVELTFDAIAALHLALGCSVHVSVKATAIQVYR